MGVFLLILSLLLITGLIFFSRGGGFGFPWVQFYVKGKESGFSIHELNLLRRVALENQLKNPTSLFWSEKTLDRCIRGTIVRFRSHDKEDAEPSVQFLGKLFDFRRRVELNLPKYRLGLRSSRNISQGQVLKLTFPGAPGAYTASVVENMRKYLAISYPKGKTSPTGFSWQGQRVNVYFWRQEDAGYYFETKVIGDYLERKFPILHISHADQLIRTQKRKSVRAELHGPGYLFPLKSIEQANENLEKTGGYRCRMVDVSEDGAAIMVGGKAKPGMPVKVQTELNGQPVVLSGVVKGVTFKQKHNASILHIEAKLPSRKMRNTILTYVYGIFRDADSGPAKISSLRKKQRAPGSQNNAVAT
ncbi:MAG: flagellar brake protein [Spirochaetaceae bacterium]